jgi:hypothetical protein
MENSFSLRRRHHADELLPTHRRDSTDRGSVRAEIERRAPRRSSASPANCAHSPRLRARSTAKRNATERKGSIRTGVLPARIALDSFASCARLPRFAARRGRYCFSTEIAIACV